MVSNFSVPVATKRLEFINVSDPNDAKAAAIRTRVRKHVMKDIGRARRRPKKAPTTFEVIFHPQCQLGSRETDPFLRFPIEMGPTEKLLLSLSMFSAHNAGHIGPWSSQQSMQSCLLSGAQGSWGQIADRAQFFVMLTTPSMLIDTNGFPLP